ncbi:MAG: VWA domain-containing protein [Anaerolineales bacterium]|nr:VWA domain-containing protein [Anaerolineales bacterium]
MATGKSMSKAPDEDLVIHEYYYVVLLVDKSQSMLWPFLEDEKNRNETGTSDYRNAVNKVQQEITFAHAKALAALRGSQICKDRYLKVYQYAFNDKPMVLNPPEELSPVGMDKVFKLTASNYYPESKTALYDVVHEALQVVEQNYLRKAIEDDRRVDKLIIGVITDGEDTMYEENSPERSQKISQIKELMHKLRGGDGYSHLYSSVLIGLTSADFTKQRLLKVKEELTFDEAISINQSDDKAIRRAFKLFSTDTAGI